MRATFFGAEAVAFLFWAVFFSLGAVALAILLSLRFFGAISFAFAEADFAALLGAEAAGWAGRIAGDKAAGWAGRRAVDGAEAAGCIWRITGVVAPPNPGAELPGAAEGRTTEGCAAI